MDKNKKESRYSRIYEQLVPLLEKSPGYISSMSTIVALLKGKIEYSFWCGFYFVANDKLTVGPYQGSLACQILQKPNGVCWASVMKKETVIVEDVGKFSSHIACDSRAKSEIVVPLFNDKHNIWSVLDVDSDKYNSFCEIDALWLNKILKLIKI